MGNRYNSDVSISWGEGGL